MKLSAITLLFAGLAALPVQALDGYVAEAGASGDIKSVRVGMIRQWDAQWLTEGDWHVTGYWDAGVAYLNDARPEGRDAASIGLSPVFRFRPNASGGSQPYWDVALGVQVLSRTKLDNRHDLGSTVQLAPLVGVGVTFGEKSQYDLGYRFQHLTNLGLEQPDDGLSQHQVRLTYLY